MALEETNTASTPLHCLVENGKFMSSNLYFLGDDGAPLAYQVLREAWRSSIDYGYIHQIICTFRL